MSHYCFTNPIFARFFKVVTFLIVTFMFLFQNESQALESNNLIVGSEEEFPPFSIGYSDDTADGFTVELWKAVAAKANLSFRLRVKPFNELISDIKTGDVEVLINLAQSDERREFVDFTVPHVTVSGGIFVSSSDNSIKNENDLRGKKVIVLDADLAHDYALNQPWAKNLKLVESALEGFKLLETGKYDAIVINKLVGEKVLKQLHVKNIKLLDTSVGYQQKFSFAVQKGNSELLAKINEGLALVKESGEYDEIYDKWFGIYHLEQPLFGNAATFFLVIFFLTLIFSVFIYFRSAFDKKVSSFKIKESNKNYQNILNAASHYAIIVTNLEGVITTFNLGAEVLLGHKSNNVAGNLNIINFHDKCELELRQSKQSQYLKKSLSEFEALVFTSLSEGSETFECNYISLENEKIFVSINVSPMRNSDEMLIGYLFIAEDIREKKKLESMQLQFLDKLIVSEATKSAILEHCPDAIMIMNQHGNFLEFNPAAEYMFGYLRSEVIGKKVSSLIISSRHREMHEEGMKAYLKTGKSKILGRKVKLSALHRDQSEFMIEITFVPYEMESEQFFLAYASDLSNTEV